MPHPDNRFFGGGKRNQQNEKDEGFVEGWIDQRHLVKPPTHGERLSYEYELAEDGGLHESEAVRRKLNSIYFQNQRFIDDEHPDAEVKI